MEDGNNVSVPLRSRRVPVRSGSDPGGIYLYVRDVDEAFRKAVDAGATVKRPLEDMFWGDRTGSVLDPFGHTWDLATHREDVSPEEMKRRGKEFFRKMEGGKPETEVEGRPGEACARRPYCPASSPHSGCSCPQRPEARRKRRLGDIKLPPGFRIAPYAEVPNARSMTLGEKGTLFVGTRDEGKYMPSFRAKRRKEPTGSSRSPGICTAPTAWRFAAVRSTSPRSTGSSGSTGSNRG